jgi:hypothetical protein
VTLPSTFGIRPDDVKAYLRGPDRLGHLPYVELAVAIVAGRGPNDADVLRAGAGALVVLTRTTTAGFLTEERALTMPVFQARCVGYPADYDSAENLAGQVDWLLMSIDRPTRMGPVRVSAVQQSGGGLPCSLWTTPAALTSRPATC